MSTSHKRALHTQLRANLSPDSITPYLNQQDLLTDDGLKKLCSVSLTRLQNLIVQLLPSKGRNWWNKFLLCLEESATEPGLPAHKELAFLLTNELALQCAYQKVSVYILILKILNYPISFFVATKLHALDMVFLTDI